MITGWQSKMRLSTVILAKIEVYHIKTLHIMELQTRKHSVIMNYVNSVSSLYCIYIFIYYWGNFEVYIAILNCSVAMENHVKTQMIETVQGTTH